MLLILIPIVWLMAMAVLVAVCRAAADGDALEPVDHADAPIGLRLLLEHGPVVDAAVHSRRAHPHVRRSHAPHRPGRRRIAAHPNR
jgi:hypothetical protein